MKVVSEYKLEFKRITENDLEILMNWRNSEHISSHLFSSPKLTMNDQLKWFEKYKQDDTQIRWIIYADGVPIGSYYLTDIDYNNGRCEVGWFVAEQKYRSMNLTLTIRWNMFDYIFDELKLNREYGFILAENKGLIRLMRIGGPDVEGVMKEHAYKNGVYQDVYITGMTKAMWYEKKKQFEYDKAYVE